MIAAEGRGEKADHQPLERADGGPHFPEVTFDAIKAAAHFVESAIDLPEPPVDLFEPLIDQFEPLHRACSNL